MILGALEHLIQRIDLILYVPIHLLLDLLVVLYAVADDPEEQDALLFEENVVDEDVVVEDILAGLFVEGFQDSVDVFQELEEEPGAEHSHGELGCLLGEEVGDLVLGACFHDLGYEDEELLGGVEEEVFLLVGELDDPGDYLDVLSSAVGVELVELGELDKREEKFQDLVGSFEEGGVFEVFRVDSSQNDLLQGGETLGQVGGDSADKGAVLYERGGVEMEFGCVIDGSAQEIEGVTLGLIDKFFEPSVGVVLVEDEPTVRGEAFQDTVDKLFELRTHTQSLERGVTLQLPNGEYLLETLCNKFHDDESK